MENTTKEKIKEILKKLKDGEITDEEACEQIEEATSAGSGPPAGGGGGGNPGGGNP